MLRVKIINLDLTADITQNAGRARVDWSVDCLLILLKFLCIVQ